MNSRGREYRIKVKYFIGALLWLFILAILISATPVLAAVGSGFMDGLQKTGEGGAGYPKRAADYPGAFLSEMLGLALTPMFMGVSAMISLAYGGYKWMMARGNDQEVETARTIIINTVIAIIVAFSAYGIVKLIIPLWQKVSR